MTHRFSLGLLAALSLCLSSLACSGSDENSNGGQGDGTATDLWSSYCLATFTEDLTAEDAFGDPTYSISAGETYVIASMESFSGDETELYFLTENGPDEFVVPNGDDAPFTSNCTDDSTIGYYAAFTDVTVYANEELTDELCKLSAGDVVMRTGSSGYSAVDITLSGPSTYEIFMSGFSEQCGADTGYIEVESTKINGASTTLVPIRPIEGPAE